MRRKIFLIGLVVLILLTLILYQIYYIRPTREVRSEIENYLDSEFSNQFDISTIEVHYSQDLFHQPNGYKIWMKDKAGLEFGPVLIEFNTVQKRWLITDSLYIAKLVEHKSFGQDDNILRLEKYFDQELKLWKNTFSNFNLTDFKIDDSLEFDNNFPQDFTSYEEFLSTYKPLLTYSQDSSKFIDIYSNQLNLEKREDYYEANPDIDGAVLLCDSTTKYWNSIFFGTSSRWIDEAIWISKTKFILVGITKSEGKNRPLVLVGDVNKGTLIEYLSSNKKCFQNDDGYSSPKLKRMKIKGL